MVSVCAVLGSGKGTRGRGMMIDDVMMCRRWRLTGWAGLGNIAGGHLSRDSRPDQAIATLFALSWDIWDRLPQDVLEGDTLSFDVIVLNITMGESLCPSSPSF